MNKDVYEAGPQCIVESMDLIADFLNDADPEVKVKELVAITSFLSGQISREVAVQQIFGFSITEYEIQNKGRAL